MQAYCHILAAVVCSGRPSGWTRSSTHAVIGQVSRRIASMSMQGMQALTNGQGVLSGAPHSPTHKKLPLDCGLHGLTGVSLLQAFRHLYVLAAEPRSIEAIDVDSRESVHVPLNITLASPGQVRPPSPAPPPPPVNPSLLLLSVDMSQHLSYGCRWRKQTASAYSRRTTSLVLFALGSSISESVLSVLLHPPVTGCPVTVFIQAAADWTCSKGSL